MRAALLVVALVGCGGKGAPATKVLPKGPIDLVLPALDGGEIDLAAYRGRVVVLHAFTTWSLDADADVEQLAAIHDPDRVAVIGLALDPEGRTLVAPWRDAHRIGYLIGLADDGLRAGNSDLGRITAVPTTIVLDRDGVVVRWVDRRLADGELAQVLSSSP